MIGRQARGQIAGAGRSGGGPGGDVRVAGGAPGGVELVQPLDSGGRQVAFHRAAIHRRHDLVAGSVEGEAGRHGRAGGKARDDLVVHAATGAAQHTLILAHDGGRRRDQSEYAHTPMLAGAAARVSRGKT
jgi:hypothetical protein